jgi:hypothetical protein
VTVSAAYAGPDAMVRRHPTCGMSRRGLPLPLNRTSVAGVRGGMGMRDFAMDTSRGLAAAGVLLSAVVHGLFGVKATATGAPVLLAELDEYAAVFFGLAAAALLSQPMRERVA